MGSSPSLENRLRFGPFELDPGGGQLRRSGAPIRLSPQPLKLLVLLASRAGDVVSREEIRTRLWGSETFVDFEQGVNHCIRSIRSVLEPGPNSPTYIETVPRRGYRFVAAVQPADPAAQGGRTGAGPLASSPAPMAAEPAPGWAGLSRLIAGWWDRLRSGRRVKTSFRLAILPFDTLTGDPTLSGGLTAEIGAHLSRLSGQRLHLLPACSAEALKETRQPVTAARDQGVDFLLAGSVWSIVDRARVNVHLVRVSDDTQLWNESYEHGLQDVLAFHTDVARAIAEGARTRLEA